MTVILNLILLSLKKSNKISLFFLLLFLEIDKKRALCYYCFMEFLHAYHKRGFQMRMKYCHYPAILLLLAFLLCACGQDGAEPEEDILTEDSGYCPARVIGPDIETTPEIRLANTMQTYENMCYSYSEMQELAESEGASKKGKKAAAKLEKKYADRIAELADTDFSQLTSEELLSVSSECLDIISAIRDVTDVLKAD